MSLPTALPLPAFVLHPLTALVIASVHLYLSAGHLVRLIDGEVQWTHFWKGFGALAGAYVFAALASRGRVKRRRQGQQIPDADEPVKLSTETNPKLIPSCWLAKYLSAVITRWWIYCISYLTAVSVEHCICIISRKV